MSRNMLINDYKTQGLVLRRTNYGEADRILNIITPLGRKVVIAKSVRKEKSKLAGNIEMFSLIDFNVHQGKSEFGIVTGAKMIEYYGNIVKDFEKLELAGVILKKISVAAESSDNPNFFHIMKQCLVEINNSMNLKLVEGWFLLNLAKAMGEEMNVFRDNNGNKLLPGKKYDWDFFEKCFVEKNNGDFGEDEIKMMRLALTMNLNFIKRVKVDDKMVLKVLSISKAII